jgi:hypothetical protein
MKPVYIEVLDLDPSRKASRIYPMDEGGPIQLIPNESVDFYIVMTMPTTAPESVQPEAYDAIVILATPKRPDQPNPPPHILPELNNSGLSEPSPVWRERNCRGVGVAGPNWSAQRVDMCAWFHRGGAS